MTVNTAIITNQTLVDRAQNQIALFQLISENHGELNPILEKWLAEIETDLATKVDDYKYKLEFLDAESKVFKAKKDDAAANYAAFENVIRRIKDRIKFVMGALGADELKGIEYRFKLSKAKPALVVDQEQLPAAYLMEVKQMVPDRERISEALERGEFVPGCRFEGGFALRSYVNKGAK